MRNPNRVWVTLLVGLCLTGLAFADHGTVTIDRTGSTTYPTIQAAITAAQDGDTILIGGGSTPEESLYRENLTINKSLVLQGYSGGVDDLGKELYPTIKGGGWNVITVNHPGRSQAPPRRVGLRWLNIDASSGGHGVFAYICELTVDGCELVGRATTHPDEDIKGIHLTDADGLWLTHSSVSDFQTGVFVDFFRDRQPGSLQVEDVGFYGVRTGIDAEHANAPRIVDDEVYNIDILDAVAGNDSDSATKRRVLRRFHTGYGVYLRFAQGGLIARVRVGGVHIGFGVVDGWNVVVRNTSFVDDLDRMDWFPRAEWLADQATLQELAHGNGGGIVVNHCHNVQVIDNQHCFGAYGAEDNSSVGTVYRNNIFRFHELNVTRTPDRGGEGTETDFSGNYFGPGGRVGYGPSDVTWQTSYRDRRSGDHGCMSDGDDRARIDFMLMERPDLPKTPQMFTPGIGTLPR